MANSSSSVVPAARVAGRLLGGVLRIGIIAALLAAAGWWSWPRVPAAWRAPWHVLPPHLHYGIYQAGGAINPYPLLQAGREG